MKLTYRGIEYDYNPATVETVENGFDGKYRGLDWRFRNMKKPPVLQPAVNLTYRGVRYQTPGVVAENRVEQAQTPALSLQDKARTKMRDLYKSQRNRQLSMLNRSAAELGVATV